MLAAAPAALAVVAARIDARLDALLAAERERWAALDPDLAAPIDEIGRLVLAGGKRLRPAFCHWGFVGAGGDPDDPRVVDAGAAFELLHAFALFHDDVMDDADRRRGTPTTHAVYRDEHRDGAWAGESRRFGEGVAILVGDLAYVYADQLLTGAPPAVWSIWNELRVELNVGQYLDLLGSARSIRDVERAERICRYKSGKYTIERPLHLGAALAEPDDLDGWLRGLSAYGLPLGDAFQMRDDVMGAFGDPAVTGKPVGTDLREGKPTPLLARAVAAATPSQRTVLDRVGAPDLDDDEVAGIQRVIVDTGALEALEAHITALTESAIASLDRLALAPPARDELVELARFVSWRQT
ncbi:MAG: polyprenyl synthetase family protein [Ilumatobacteraceae bacterium]|nr:polyprenyl synthetase family protein [Ilumatobacteraceae bacterium]